MQHWLIEYYFFATHTLLVSLRILLRATIFVKWPLLVLLLPCSRVLLALDGVHLSHPAPHIICFGLLLLGDWIMCYI